MIDLAPSHLRTVRQLLAGLAPECEVRVFGSRVAGSAKHYSDLDIVLIGGGRLPPVRVSALREAFAESDLPIRVDVLDWHAIPERFRNIITEHCEVLQPGTDKAAATAAGENSASEAPSGMH
jgi:predicted nucleotidyltransferase